MNRCISTLSTHCLAVMFLLISSGASLQAQNSNQSKQSKQQSTAPASKYTYSPGDKDALRKYQADKNYRAHPVQPPVPSKDEYQDLANRVSNTHERMVKAVAACKEGSSKACEDKESLKAKARAEQKEAQEYAQQHER